jgi:hypothetical protein
MLSFSSPWFLLALLAVPLLWWLHRFREQGQLFPVAALFLWSGAEEPGVGGRLASRPQAIWVLRAVLVSLLALALAGPLWRAGEARELTVWVDDSPSMYSTDGGEQTRLQRAMHELWERTAKENYASVTLRSLGVPGRSRMPEAGETGPIDARWYPIPGGEPTPPMSLAMAADSEHWLLSDGASRILQDWVREAPLAGLVRVGGDGANVGISGLVLRRSPREKGAGQLLVSLRNGGPGSADRTLEVFAGGERLLQTTVSLGPEAEASRLLALAEIPLRGLTARLSPGDALPLDDSLEIAAGELQTVAVNLSGDCGTHLRAALAAHPDLRIEDTARGPGLPVHCGPGPLPERGPALLLAAGDSAGLPRGNLFWHAGAGQLRDLILPPDSLRLVATAAVPDSGLALLSVGTTPLVSHDPLRQLISVGLDLSAPQLVRLPEYPLLVSGLVDQVLDREADAGLVVARRGADFSRIAPRELALRPAGVTGRVARQQRELSGQLILAALVLLCADLMLLLWRRQRRSRRLEDWRGRYES